MRVTKEEIKSLRPCPEAWEWYLREKRPEDLKELLLITNSENPSWSRWLFTKLMTKNQNVEIAIFSALLVIEIFEKRYPNDKRPRKAIEAAKRYLDNPSEANRRSAFSAAADADAAAFSAAYAAAAAADAADAAFSAAAAADAADAAFSAAAAADAAFSAADAAADADADADAADAAAVRKSLQEKIIHEAVRILESK